MRQQLSLELIKAMSNEPLNCDSSERTSVVVLNAPDTAYDRIVEQVLQALEATREKQIQAYWARTNALPDHPLYPRCATMDTVPIPIAAKECALEAIRHLPERKYTYNNPPRIP